MGNLTLDQIKNRAAFGIGVHSAGSGQFIAQAFSSRSSLMSETEAFNWLIKRGITF